MNGIPGKGSIPNKTQQSSRAQNSPGSSMKYQPDQQPPEPSAPAFDGTQACAGVDPNVFFLPSGGNNKAKIDRAKAICETCRFLAPCLEYALTTRTSGSYYVIGVWGHTTAGERAAIRQRRLSPDVFQAAS